MTELPSGLGRIARWFSICILWTVMVPATVVCEDSQFPLEIGNWWQYQCTYIHPEDQGPLHPGIVICRQESPGQLVYADLAVTGSISIGRDIQGWFSVIPEAAPGDSSTNYFVLEGSIVRLFVSENELRCAGAKDEEPTADAMLVRYGEKMSQSSLEGLDDYLTSAIPSGVWLRAFHIADQWWVFEQEHLLWDVSPAPGGIPIHALFISDCLQWHMERVDLTDPQVPVSLLTVPAGTFPCGAIVKAGTDNGGIGSPQLTICFSPSIGIVKVSELELRSASVAGIKHGVPTHVSPRSWGRLKKKEAKP